MGYLKNAFFFYFVCLSSLKFYFVKLKVKFLCPVHIFAIWQ